MNARIMLQFFLILICIAGFRVAVAQGDYLVLTRGDTLYGKVKFLDYGADKKVTVTDGKEKTTYPMLQVKAFFMENESYLLVRRYDRYQYMKPLFTEGYLSLYAFQPDNLVTWDGRFLFKRDGAGMDVPNLGFKRKLADFLAECPDLAEEINTGELGRNDITEIVSRYNACIDARTVVESSVARREPQPVPVVHSNLWTDLEEGIRGSDKLDDKETLLEMVHEAKSKAARNERIPNFLLDGIRKSLEPEPELKELLTKVLLNEKED